MVLENYVEHMRTLAQQQGRRLSIEGYDGTSDDMRYAGRADEPMTLMWLLPSGLIGPVRLLPAQPIVAT